MPLPLLHAIVVLPEEVLQQGSWVLQCPEFLYETRAVPESVYTFKHALTQKVAYESLLMSRRRLYHERIARALEEHLLEIVECHPERMASHYCGGNPGPVRQSVDHVGCITGVI